MECLRCKEPYGGGGGLGRGTICWESDRGGRRWQSGHGGHEAIVGERQNGVRQRIVKEDMLLV